MSKVKVMSKRSHVLTLPAEEGKRIVLNPGMNEVSKASWDHVKEHPSVASMLKAKSLEEVGGVKEKAPAPVKKVEDVVPEVKEEAPKEEAPKKDKK